MVQSVEVGIRDHDPLLMAWYNLPSTMENVQNHMHI